MEEKNQRFQFSSWRARKDSNLEPQIRSLVLCGLRVLRPQAAVQRSVEAGAHRAGARAPTPGNTVSKVMTSSRPLMFLGMKSGTVPSRGAITGSKAISSSLSRRRHPAYCSQAGPISAGSCGRVRNRQAHRGALPEMLSWPQRVNCDDIVLHLTCPLLLRSLPN